MRKLQQKDLEAGMVLARDIVTKHGQVIAEKGVTLTDQLIARISFYRAENILVEGDDPEPEATELPTPEPPAPEPPAPEPVEPPKEPEIVKPTVNETISYTEKLRSKPEFQDFQLIYSRNIARLKEAFSYILAGDYASFSPSMLLDEAEDIFRQRTVLDLLDLLHTNRALDDSVYVHSLNVAIIAHGIGKWLKMPKQDMDVLTLAGLLHDIGKMQIPEEVLNKTGQLTDEEFNLIRQHPQMGNKILKKVPGLDARIIYATLQHHERFDGSGYPRNLDGDEIDDTAAIIAIADVYDAMTAARSYRAAKCAFQVIEAFEDDGLQKYNPKFILTFLDRIASSYQNSRVLLSDGSRCRIIYINHNKLSRPMVQFDDGSVIDLTTRTDLHITSIL